LLIKWCGGLGGGGAFVALCLVVVDVALIDMGSVCCVGC